MNIHKLNRKFSQSGQDAFVISYFNNKRNGVFVDIGANDGKTLSNTFYLEKELGWTGICFEPMPALFNQLDTNRNCIKIMAGVGESNTHRRFTQVVGPANMLSGLSDEYDERHKQRIALEVKTRGGSVEEIEINTVILNEILDANNIVNVDYISLDTEGNEFKIIKTIDFDKFNIKVITIENNYNDTAQTNYIISKGYYMMGKLEADEVFVKIKK